jgi:hypothetical protein
MQRKCNEKEQESMNVTLTHQFPPTEGNPRNSEGAFLRGKQGEILFAYSCYHGASNHDHAACNIALTVSWDEGKSWSEPRLIARAEELGGGVENIMSVSATEQKNGDLAFYFLIKEPDLTTTLGRAVSGDGVNFRVERCRADFPPAYYVVNNDRLVRLRDGRILAPAAYISAEDCRADRRVPYVTTLLISEDDGESFYKADFDYTTTDPLNMRYGLQEPGVIENADGSLYLWMRTNYYCQYECESAGDVNVFTLPHASQFTSPPSPMQVKDFDGARYAVYNPTPRYNGRVSAEGTWDRTPFVIRKSTDGGKTYGPLNMIEDDPTRGYCYPAVFQTNDGHLLLAYCRGDAVDGNTLCRLGIARAEIASIE